MARKFKTYEEAVKYLDDIDQSDFEQLSLARGKTGWTVAHELAFSNELMEEFITPEILLIRTDFGFTVAHMLANKDKLAEKYITPEILKSSTDNGRTVAYILAIRGNLPEKFMVPDILLLKYNKRYVYEHTSKYKNLTIDSVKDVLGLYLLTSAKYRYPKVDFDEFKGLIDKHGLGKMKQMVKLTGKRND